MPEITIIHIKDLKNNEMLFPKCYSIEDGIIFDKILYLYLKDNRLLVTSNKLFIKSFLKVIIKYPDSDILIHKKFKKESVKIKCSPI